MMMMIEEVMMIEVVVGNVRIMLVIGMNSVIEWMNMYIAYY